MVKCERFVKCDDCVNERDIEELLAIAEEICDDLSWLDDYETEQRRAREAEEEKSRYEESEWAAGYAEFNRNMRDVAAGFNGRR